MLRPASRLAFWALLVLLLALPAGLSAQTAPATVAQLQETLTQDSKALADIGQGLQAQKGGDARALQGIKDDLDKTRKDLEALHQNSVEASSLPQPDVNTI